MYDSVSASPKFVMPEKTTSLRGPLLPTLSAYVSGDPDTKNEGTAAQRFIPFATNYLFMEESIL